MGYGEVLMKVLEINYLELMMCDANEPGIHDDASNSVTIEMQTS